MTAIVGFADLLAETVTRPEHLEAVDTIKRNGEHLLHIINDILDLSKTDAERMTIEQAMIDPLEIVDEVLRLVRVRTEGKGLVCRKIVAGKIPERIWSDPLRLRQILTNLVGNAVKFTEQGEVRVTVTLDETSEPAQLAFEVSDTGIGIRHDQLPHLFEPFMQADTSTTRRFGGTGLGLTISRRFARMLGGDISVTSELGVGSTFRLTIATGLAEGAGGQAASDRLSRVAAPASGAEGHDAKMIKPLAGRRLLLAEDGPDNQRLLLFLLSKAGAQTQVVENGRLAVEAVERSLAGEPFDGVLLDMQMAVMDGYDAARAMRRAGYSGPIIALTAHAMSGDREKCLAAGCDDYVTKPIDRQTLYGALGRWLPAREGAAV
jgi:CheY-like chemotaxis protein